MVNYEMGVSTKGCTDCFMAQYDYGRPLKRRWIAHLKKQDMKDEGIIEASFASGRKSSIF